MKTHCDYSVIKHNGTQMTQINMMNADNSIKILHIIIISVICVPFFQLLSSYHFPLKLRVLRGE